MPYNNKGFDVVNNPMTTSPYNLDPDIDIVIPGTSKIITTENFIYLTTETGQLLITEN